LTFRGLNGRRGKGLGEETRKRKGTKRAPTRKEAPRAEGNACSKKKPPGWSNNQPQWVREIAINPGTRTPGKSPAEGRKETHSSKGRRGGDL